MTVFICILIVLAVFFLLVMAADCNRFVVKEYSCRSELLKKSATIVLLSDLHNKSFGEDNRRLIRAIDQAAPDIILIAGDMYTCEKNGDTHVAQQLVCRLAEKYPVYYGNGNHEQKTKLYAGEFGLMYEKYWEKALRAGVRRLCNQHMYLPEYNINIYGLEIERHYYRKGRRMRIEKAYVENQLGKADKTACSVLIAHNPDYFETYAAWGADLVVSGHIHGGLMRLPLLGGVLSPALRLFPKYDGGEFKEGRSTMILSRGLGTHTLPVRIFNPGELAVIHLDKVD